MKRALLVVVLAATLLSGPLRAGTIPNWAAPGTWTPSLPGETAGTGFKAALVTTYPPLPFIPVTPCRVADTRAASGFPAGYGPPSLPGVHALRTFTITGPCGIPAGAQAVSFNFTVWAPVTRGDLRVFPAGPAVPAVATLNWEAGIQALANAAVVPLGAGGAITVQVDGPGTIDLIFDVNGYYAQDLSDSSGKAFAVTSSGPYGIVAQAASVAVKGTGGTFGVGGSSADSSGAGVVGTGTNDAVGVLGITLSGAGPGVVGTSASAHGVHGLGAGSSGKITFGVLGDSRYTETDSAGVMGRDGSTPPVINNLSPSSGVRGESGLRGVVGVAGPAGWGVTGISVDGLGSAQQGGILGAGNTYGVWAMGNMGASGAKPFVEPHPNDPSKVIRYVALEGNEAGTYFRGTARVVEGTAVIEVPESFRIVTDEEGLTIQLTPVGALTAMAVMSQDLDRIVVRSAKDVTFHYLVQGVRRAYRDWQVVADGTEFAPRSPKETLPSYLSDEARRRLVQNGTYNSDGTVNMQTAERMGWAQRWREAEQLRQQAGWRSTLEPVSAPRQQ